MNPDNVNYDYLKLPRNVSLMQIYLVLSKFLVCFKTGNKIVAPVKCNVCQ